MKDIKVTKILGSWTYVDVLYKQLCYFKEYLQQFAMFIFMKFNMAFLISKLVLVHHYRQPVYKEQVCSDFTTGNECVKNLLHPCHEIH